VSPRDPHLSALTPPQRPGTGVEVPGRLGERRRLGARLRGAFLDHLGLKALSFILAVTVYLLINTDEQREISARVRVAYVLPPGKALVSERVDEVRVAIRGPWRRIKRFDEREIDRIDLDLSNVPPGELAITPDMIRVPRGLEITAIEPRVVRVAFEDLATRQVAVTPSFAGRPLRGYQVAHGSSRVAPAVVAVRGAAGVVAALDRVRTREIRVDGRSDTFTVTVPLVPPPGVAVDPEDVQVTVAVDEELVTRRRAGVPVTIVGGPGVDPTRWTLELDTVEVVLTGGLVAVESWIEQGLTATVMVPADAAARPVEAPVQVTGAAPGVGVRVSPPRVTLRPAR
jgi:YbbR domain-containing protein